MYIDGIYMPRTTGPYMSVLDIERIEVLRGPQGTLFGRNSTGGAIRVFTQQPGPEREGYVKLTAGDFGRADLSAMINVPLGDSVYFRVAGRLAEPGRLRARAAHRSSAAPRTRSAACSSRFEPSDEFRRHVRLELDRVGVRRQPAGSRDVRHESRT